MTRTVLGMIFSRRWAWATVLVIAGTALCVRLGIWQLDRLAQRRAFNAHYYQVVSMPMLHLAAAPSEDLTTMDYRKVEATGTYDFDHQVVLRNRSYSNVPSYGSLVPDNEPGYDLLTPLVLSDGSAILVDRGWIPSAGNDTPDKWHQYDVLGVVTVDGILRQGETQPEMGGVPDPTLQPGQTHLDYWNLVNVERIGQQLPYPLLPAFIEPNPDNRTTPPIPSQPQPDLSEGPHMGYAVQWFLFASLLFFGYPIFYLRKQALEMKK